MNVKYEAKTKTVTLTFAYDPNKTYPESSTKKTLMVASTGGFQSVDGAEGLKVSINATVPNPNAPVKA